MANHKSAWKRIRQNEKRNSRNIHFKTLMRGRIRRVKEAIAAQQPEAASEALTKAISAIDKVASKGIVHKNTAARQVARLSKAVHRLSKITASAS